MIRLKHTFRLLHEQVNTLILFETLYRLIGLAIIFPMARQLFYFSITLYGNAYITNADLMDYLLSPGTLLLSLLLGIMIGLYLLYEVIVLSFIFHESEYGKHHKLYSYLLAGLKKLRQVLKQYHIKILLSVSLFVFTIELVHISGIASTVTLPNLIQERLGDMPYFDLLFVIFVICVVVMFFHTLFYELLVVTDNTHTHSPFLGSIKLFYKTPLTTIRDFIMINALMNGFLYILYMIVVGIVALIVSFIYSELAIFGIMLSGLYTIYVVIGFIATLLLMPINYAFIHAVYFELKETKDISLAKSLLPYEFASPWHLSRNVKRLFIGALALLLAFNIYLVRDSVINYNVPVQLFNRPRIIAHRGSSLDAPENTIAAIEQAIDDGADAIEIDVRFTKDNVPILMHDATLGRTTDDPSNRFVEYLRYDEIDHLDAGSWFSDEFAGEPIPTLAQVLTLTRGRINVYIELKASVENTPEILTDIIRDTRTEHQVKILSFNGLLLEEIKTVNNDIDTVQLISTFLGNIDVLANNEMIDYYGLSYRLIEGNVSVIKTLKQHGKGIFVYTVNDETKLEKMNTLGVDGIITDRPRYVRELVYKDLTNDTLDQILKILFKRNE
ncbi:MAG: glycerophosphodiester phosphodiesterase family protein [Candidatus Izemoplasma sp.]|nr:glycerophosphodiester phosphodiesterase family protein [Candidatus Izemoplasma sp.]